MNDLIKINRELALDSREVAEMVGKEHSKLIRDIRTYEEYLGEANFGLTDFFIESTYTSNQNKELPNYQVTKKGCEFIAHKMTGQKGTLFTATYINKFHEMEQVIKQPQISSHKDEELKIKSTRAEAMLRNARVREAKFLLDQADKRKGSLSPESFELLQINGFELVVGKNVLPRPKLESKLYDLTGIASKLGINSNSGAPHAQAVGAIISQIHISDREKIVTAFERNGHQGSTNQYTESVVNKVKGWLVRHDYPASVTAVASKGKVKTFKIAHKKEIA